MISQYSENYIQHGVIVLQVPSANKIHLKINISTKSADQWELCIKEHLEFVNTFSTYLLNRWTLLEQENCWNAQLLITVFLNRHISLIISCRHERLDAACKSAQERSYFGLSHTKSFQRIPVIYDILVKPANWSKYL